MPEVGIVIPAHASALGKAMLAFVPDDGGRSRAGGELRSMTGETITSSLELADQLAAVRATGTAVEVDEAVLGECGLASPVFDASGLVSGAIGVVVPAGAWPVDDATRDVVREAARAVSRELGAATWPPPPH
jgi:DNA-binding IclR family transcriptional regulator